MKLLAGILAFIILTLSVQPAFASFADADEMECSSECCKHEKKQQPEDEHSGNECSDFCNPLLKCGTCAIVNITFFHYSIQSLVNINSKPAVLNRPFHSQFSPDFWQPPKLA